MKPKNPSSKECSEDLSCGFFVVSCPDRFRELPLTHSVPQDWIIFLSSALISFMVSLRDWVGRAQKAALTPAVSLIIQWKNVTLPTLTHIIIWKLFALAIE